MPTTKSKDGTEIYFEKHGEKSSAGKPALLFAHGWLGNTSWWHAQREHFQKSNQVVLMDLGGHGKSGMGRTDWSVRTYAEDMAAVIKAAELEEVVLVGHSMSGAYAMEAVGLLPDRIRGIVLVDTLLDLDQQPSGKDMAPFFAAMKADYPGVVRTGLPERLFGPFTPDAVAARIQSEFLKVDAAFAIDRLRPLYETDIRPACKNVKIPVRAINTDKAPTNVDVNRKYLSDFDAVIIPGLGHYPMLEAPEKFNAALEKFLPALPEKKPAKEPVFSLWIYSCTGGTSIGVSGGFAFGIGVG